MIDTLAWKLARGLKAQNPDHPRSVEVLKHAISFLLNTGFTILLTILISIFTGKVMEAVTVLVTYAILRQFSGGAHLKSGTLCVIISSIGATLITYSYFNQSIVIALNCVAIILAALYAPSKLEARIKRSRYPLLKLISILIISSNFLFNSPILATTFLVQSLTLIRRGGENK